MSGLTSLPARFGRWLAGLAKRGRAEDAADSPIEVVVPEALSEPAPQPPPEVVVNERSARALLATGTPPPPPEQQKPARRRRLERRSEPVEPETASVVVAPPREWNLWELQRAVRTSDDRERQEEWGALFIHLREFANTEGNLPVEFDELVRESFAGYIEHEPEGAAS